MAFSATSLRTLRSTGAGDRGGVEVAGSSRVAVPGREEPLVLESSAKPSANRTDLPLLALPSLCLLGGDKCDDYTLS